MNIWFIIVTYKPERKKLIGLLSVLPHNFTLVIDNTQKNIGYAGGINLGLTSVLKRHPDWITIINQDATITPLVLHNFENKLRKINSGLAGPFAGTLDIKRWTTIYPFCHKIDYLSGAFLAIHRKVIEKIGGFYEPYFMYYEDVDFCLRAVKEGFKLHHIKCRGIEHEDNSSLGKNSFLHQYYLARNHLLFVRQNAPAKILLREYIRLPKSILEANPGTKKGIFDYLLNKFGQYENYLRT